MGITLDPLPTQSPSGRLRGVGFVGPQPAILQQQLVEATPGTSYAVTSLTAFDTIEFPLSAGAILTFPNVQQVAALSVYLYVDFRMAAVCPDGSVPIVQIEADLDDGAGFIIVPQTRQPRLATATIVAQQWEMAGRLQIPANTGGTIVTRARWRSGNAGVAISTQADPASSDPAVAPGGWSFKAQIAQFTP